MPAMIWLSCVALGMMVVLLPRLTLRSAIQDSPGASATSLGATPIVMAVAGLSASDASEFLSSVASSPEATQLAAAQDGLEAALSHARLLRAQVRLDPLNSGLVGQWQSARQSVANARTAVQTARSNLIATATAFLSPTAAARLAAARAGSNHHTPPEFWAVSRTDEEWEGVEQAVTIEERALQRGQEVPQDVAALLAATRADPLVVQAQVAIATQLAAIQAAFGP